MNAEYALAQASSSPSNNHQEQTRGQTAALQGHDEDIPTETYSLTSTETFSTPTQEFQPTFSSEQSSSATAPVAISSGLPPQGQHAGIPKANNDPSPGLLPSTISQWLPQKSSSALSGNQTITGGALRGIGSTDLNPALEERSEKNDVLAPQRPAESIAQAPSQAPKAVSSTSSERLSTQTSRPTAPTKPEELQASIPKTAPYHPQQNEPSEDAKNLVGPIPEVAASATQGAHFISNAEKASTSSLPAPNGKPTPTSSSFEQEVDLEASHLEKKELETDQKEVDPNIVDWDGPDDPKNPMNWSEKLKWANIIVIASITFLTPLASSMLAPAVPQVMTEFKSTNQELASFVVSVYVLGYAFGPLIIAPLSELYGRVIIYHACNLLFIVFTIACGVSSNLNMLIGWRFLQGTFGSCPLTIGGGTISDMIIQQKRGGVMAIWAMGPLLGPIIGPVAGGYLAQAKGWRWGFWIIAMAAGFITILAFFSLRESYPPVLLERKAKRLRKETGNENLKSKLASPLTPAALFRLSIVRPMKLLLFSPIVLALSTYMAVVYGYLYLLFTTITEVYEGQYHFSQGTVGLTYLGIGVGSMMGVIIFGIASDKIVKAKSKTGEMKAEYRLPPMIPGSFLVPIGLFVYGWTADKHVFWLVPILGTGLVGIGLLATFMPIQTYLVDAFTIYAASALAANTVLRSLVGAVLPLAGQKMYATLGLGWGNSLLAFIALAMCPIPVIFYRYGEKIRKSPRFQIEL